ncbi:hypothetical protein [Mesorhizobium sp. SP-1A]|uniref:hypothetical protein n=1 Tax=Mesorhizobium sp. SP-1A TaxID=3077840 RepID=UPI0028F6F27B|nr:hypothetical protein [Mesorhizobium sp. SP-1A]
MNNNSFTEHGRFRLAGSLLLAGQFGYIIVTQLHAGGNANQHHEIFETYAHSRIWGLVHIGQFGSMAVLLAGLLVFASAFNSETGAGRWLARLGAAATVAALALYAALQAVDGVALKESVSAWAAAPEAEKAARFAVAESIRWLEWGIRSYQDFALGGALLLLAGAAYLSSQLPRSIGSLIGLSGLAYIAQGWIAGTEGFSAAQSIWIVAGWALGIIWMAWLTYTSRLANCASVSQK